MNLISCSEKCRHQQDGYCCLEGGSPVTNSNLVNCCHFENSTIVPEIKNIERGEINDNN